MKDYKMDPELRKKIDGLSSEERVKRASLILKKSEGMDQAVVMNYFLDDCGLSMTEYLEALNFATSGELLKGVLDE